MAYGKTMDIFNFQHWRHFVRQLAQHFRDTHCQKSAGALTYMTLFAIVPIMTVTYSMFSVIPAFQGAAEQLQQLIFENFVPDTGQEVQKYLAEFSTQARNLTSVGVAMLVVTAYFMLKNIENTFNNIWGVLESRKGLANFLLYWAVLSLGPLLLGVALAVSGYLLSLKLFSAENDILGILAFFLKLLPFALTTAAFTLLFAAVPNCRVTIKHAAVGGFVTALAFELSKKLFSVIVAQTSLEAIYGAFAVVPLFLVWIYVMWMMVLGGSVFTRTLSMVGNEDGSSRYSDFVAALLVLWAFYQRWQQGKYCSDHHIAKVGVEGPQWTNIRQRLLERGIISTTIAEDYVLSKDLVHLSLLELSELLGIAAHTPRPNAYLESLPWYGAMRDKTQCLDQAAGDQYGQSVAALFSSQALKNTASQEVKSGV